MIPSLIAPLYPLTDRDHDEQTNVIEAVKKLNEVKGVRGIRRFFKQVAQSAKGADQDDFLGCITIPVQVKGKLQWRELSLHCFRTFRAVASRVGTSCWDEVPGLR